MKARRTELRKKKKRRKKKRSVGLGEVKDEGQS